MADVTAVTDPDQLAWYDVWGQLKKSATDLDGAVAALDAQRDYALARPELATDWQAKRDEIETARGRVTWLRDAIKSTMSLFGVELAGLGFLPLIPIAVITAGVAYIANLAAEAWALSQKIGEQQRLESKGMTPAQAAAIVQSTAAAGASGSTTDQLKKAALWIGLGLAAWYLLPHLLGNKR